MEEKELEMAEAGENTEEELTEEAVEESSEEVTEEAGGEAEDETENGEVEEPSVPPYARSGRGIRISGPMLYENSFTVTQEVYQEFLKATLGRYRKIYYVIGAVSFLGGLFPLLGGRLPSAMLCFVITFLCIFLPEKTYRSSKKKNYKQQVEKNGGKPLERRVVFYMSGLEVFSNNGAHSVFRYGDITRITASKSLYVLVVQKKLSLLVLKDSFTKGTLEEWKTFMNKKGLWKVK